MVRSSVHSVATLSVFRVIIMFAWNVSFGFGLDMSKHIDGHIDMLFFGTVRAVSCILLGVYMYVCGICACPGSSYHYACIYV